MRNRFGGRTPPPLRGGRDPLRRARSDIGLLARRTRLSRDSARPFLTVVLGFLVFSTLFAGPRLSLRDGRELKGTDLHRDGDLYLLEIAGGSVIPIPGEIVKEVAWIEEESAPSAGSGVRAVTGMVTSRTEAEQREAEQRQADKDRELEEWSSRRRSEDQQRREEMARDAEERRGRSQAPYGHPSNRGGGIVLAGPDIRPPTAAEQLAVFGGPSQWQQDVVHFDLHPSYWVPDPDQAVGTPSVFMKTPRDSTWTPTDGFATSGH